MSGIWRHGLKARWVALGPALLMTPAIAQVNFSLNFGQPGYYGRVEVGDDSPRPVLLYQQPVIIERSRNDVGQPVYVNVPPLQARNWSGYCSGYRLCNRPVYFVNNNWYEQSYVPAYRKYKGKNYYHGNKHYKNKDD